MTDMKRLNWSEIAPEGDGTAIGQSVAADND